MNILKSRRFLFFLCLMSFIKVAGQEQQEFEGVVTYKHDVKATAKGYDIERDFNYIGRQSDFFYKSGNYKWLNQDAFIEMDMFRNKDSVEFLKMQSTDSVLIIGNNQPNEQIIDYKIFENADTILGNPCNVLIIKSFGNGSAWTRKYSFSKEFSVNPDFFKNYKSNSTNTIYSLMNAVPLKIQLIYSDRTIIYTAIKVERKQLQNKLFEFDAKTKFKRLM